MSEYRSDYERTGYWLWCLVYGTVATYTLCMITLILVAAFFPFCPDGRRRRVLRPPSWRVLWRGYYSGAPEDDNGDGDALDDYIGGH